MAKRSLLNERLNQIERDDRVMDEIHNDPMVVIDLDGDNYTPAPKPAPTPTPAPSAPSTPITQPTAPVKPPKPPKQKKVKPPKRKKDKKEYDGGNMLRKNQRGYSEFNEFEEYDFNKTSRHSAAMSVFKEVNVIEEDDIPLYNPDEDLPVITQKVSFQDRSRRLRFAVKHWFTPLHTAIFMIALFLLFVAIGQLPTAIYNASNSSGSSNITLDAKSLDIQQSLLEAEADKDWDMDGVLNSKDDSPFNPDADANGVLDGDANSVPISSPTTFNRENIIFVTDNPNASVTRVLDYYVFNDYKGWVKFQNTTGTVYVSKDGYNWKQAKTQTENNDTYVGVSGDCYLRVLSQPTYKITKINFFGLKFDYCNAKGEKHNVGFMKGVFDVIFGTFFPKENGSSIQYCSITKTTALQESTQDVIAPAVIGQYNLTDERFIKINNSISDLDKVYKLIDKDHTVLCSVQTDEGEAVLLIYGYDKMGNLYVMDSATSTVAGCIKIHPKSRIISSSNAYVLKDWYEFSGLGFNSEDGDRMVFLEAE